MKGWGSKENKEKIRKAMNNNNWYTYYYGMFEGTYRKEIDAWDIQWFHCILNHNALSIHPSVNLVRNIGFGPEATNTFEPVGPYSNMLTGQMEFPLKHPEKVMVDKKYLRTIYRFVIYYNKTILQIIKYRLRRFFTSDRLHKKI